MAAGDIIIEDGVITASILDKIASEVEQRLASTAKDPGEYEEVSSLTGVSSMPVFQASGNVYRLVRVAVSILHGKDGREVSFRVSDEYIQWRYTDGDWQSLISLAELRKPAEEATAAAKVAAQKANQSAETANAAASKADTATQSANTAAQKANSSAETANQSSKTANAAAQRVDEAILNISAEKEAAIAAANNANEKALAADTAASKTYEAIEKASTATQKADTAANTASSSAEAADSKIEEMNAGLARLEELEKSITAITRNQPKSMTLKYPSVITFGNKSDLRIVATLSPAGTGDNVLFLSDDKAVSVSPDGIITVIAPGKSRIHVIPTENTSIYRTIEIEVKAKSLRKVSGDSLRITENNNLRLN